MKRSLTYRPFAAFATMAKAQVVREALEANRPVAGVVPRVWIGWTPTQSAPEASYEAAARRRLEEEAQSEAKALKAEARKAELRTLLVLAVASEAKALKAEARTSDPTCPVCDGTGWVGDEFCPRCGGWGSIRSELEAAYASARAEAIEAGRKAGLGAQDLEDLLRVCAMEGAALQQEAVLTSGARIESQVRATSWDLLRKEEVLRAALVIETRARAENLSAPAALAEVERGLTLAAEKAAREKKARRASALRASSRRMARLEAIVLLPRLLARGEDKKAMSLAKRVRDILPEGTESAIALLALGDDNRHPFSVTVEDREGRNGDLSVWALWIAVRGARVARARFCA